MAFSVQRQDYLCEQSELLFFPPLLMLWRGKAEWFMVAGGFLGCGWAEAEAVSRPRKKSALDNAGTVKVEVKEKLPNERKQEPLQLKAGAVVAASETA